MQGRKPPSDPELIAMIKAGKQAALLDLFDQAYPPLRHYVLRNSGREEDVDDIVQEALVALWQKIVRSDIDLTARLSTLVFAIGKNIWMNRLRKSSRIQSLDPSMDQPEPAPRDEKPMDMRLVHACMNELGETCRKLLGYFYFDGFTMAECASLLEYNNADTAKAKKHLCMKQLETIVKSRYRKEDFFS